MSSKLDWALNQHGYIVMGGTLGSTDASVSETGIVQNHAYSLLEFVTLLEENGDKVADLIKLRNPWGTESYHGPWSDSSSLWTEFYEN